MTGLGLAAVGGGLALCRLLRLGVGARLAAVAVTVVAAAARVGLGAVFVFVVVGDLELFDLDAVADGVAKPLDETLVLVGRDPALGDEGSIAGRELQGRLRALDLDRELLLDAKQERALLGLDLRELRVDLV